MCICVCLDNDENVFHVYLCLFRKPMRIFSMYIRVCLDNDENAFHVHSCVLRQG